MSTKKVMENSTNFSSFFKGIKLILSKNNFLFSNKGQVTVFIIVGIIILFIFAGILFLTQSTVKESVDTAGEPIIASVPQVFQPIQIYTENCLRDVSKRGTLILGEQGGYIYPDFVGEYSADNPTDSNGISLGQAKVPYWFYNVEPNSAAKISLRSLQPSLYYDDHSELSIEAQLSRYVRENINSCLNDYAPFVEQGFIITIDEKKDVEVKVVDSSVNFWLKMEVKAEKGDAVNEMHHFYIKLPLDLKRYYELAAGIVLTEKNYSFLERQGLDLIAIFSAVDSQKLPPTSAMTFELAPTARWLVGDVKENLKGMLSSYVPMLNFLSSDNYYTYQYPGSELSPLFQRNYDLMTIPLLDLEGLNFAFDYLGWEPYLKMNDANGVVLPQSGTYDLFIGPLGIQDYRAVYDFSYPVLATIEDPRAFNGEGYKFVFSMEANIRNNKPVKDEGAVPQMVSSVQKTMVCDRDKRNSNILRAVVVDGSTGESLEAVQIGFSVPDQDNCIMGQTDAVGLFESSYPKVYGGVMSFVKEEYLTNFYPIDTYSLNQPVNLIGYAADNLASNVPENKVITLYPYKEINFIVKKKNLEKCIDNNCFYSGILSSSVSSSSDEGVYSYQPDYLETTHKWIFNGVSSSLNEKEEAVFTLRRVSGIDDSEETPFITGGVFSGGAQEQVQKIKLVPGIYQVSGSLILNDRVIIPKEERCTGGVVEALFCWDTDGCCFTIDEIVMEKFFSGSIAWDESKYYLKITPEQLYGAETVEFYIPSLNLKNVPLKTHQRVVEDLEVMGQLGVISQIPNVQESLEPKFK